jgi:hypothetical protein
MVRELIHCNTIEKRIFVGLIVSVFAFAGIYVYLVNQTVLHVVERRALEEEIGTLASYVTELELVHLELNNSVTLEQAYALGFTEATGVTYLTRDSLARNTTR